MYSPKYHIPQTLTSYARSSNGGMNTEGAAPKLQVAGMCSNVARLATLQNVSHQRVISGLKENKPQTHNIFNKHFNLQNIMSLCAIFLVTI